LEKKNESEQSKDVLKQHQGILEIKKKKKGQAAPHHERHASQPPTGTPLLKTIKQTSLEVFGKYIHTYKLDEAVQDEVVLDLIYEAWFGIFHGLFELN